MHIYTGIEISFQDGSTFETVDSTHPKFDEIVNLCLEGNYEAAGALLSIKEDVVEFLLGSEVTLEGETLVYQGAKVPELLAKRILDMKKKGFTVAPLVEFLKNLMTNTSKRAVDELYGFLESSKLPITDDGHFLAYKSVRQDYKDHHSGTMDNSVGQIVKMTRNMVDEDKNRTCSSGLHFAAHEYASGFGRGGRMVILKINPRDVVAIPSDYNDQKGRCCRYEVIDEVTRDDTALVGASVVKTKEEPKEEPKATVDWPFPVGTRVVINEEGLSKYGNARYNPEGVVGTAKESILAPDWITIVWDNGTSNSYEEGTLDVVAKESYVPQVDNYGDPKLWAFGDFIGEAKEFPVNRGSTYALFRRSTDKEYGPCYFVNYDTKHDNLVFKSYDGADWKFTTVADLDDWEIETDIIKIGS